jgi:uncharacterized protein YbjT (DUF2867 family)
MNDNFQPVFVAGATGYVGGRLVPRLLESGYRVRVMVRNPEKILSRSWGENPLLKIIKGDVLDAGSLEQALTSCKTAFYLVHSMISKKDDYARADRVSARNMAHACEKNGIKRIIYLGGLGGKEGDASEHLKSRVETAMELMAGKTPVTWLRAAMIIGSGSASFEIMRYLVDRLPIMVTPRWVRSEVQPIAIRDVLGYLVGCLENPDTAGKTFDIGGKDVLNYETLFQIYAEEAGLAKRIIVPVPVLTPTLSSYWIHLVTPVPASIAFPLARGLKNRVVVENDTIKNYVRLDLLDCRTAIRYAIDRIGQAKVETRWSDAGELRLPEWAEPGDALYAGGTVLKSEYSKTIDSAPEKVWGIIKRVGGVNGWFYGTALWRLRGLWDRITGGVGLSRGRREDGEIRLGDAIDCWRVVGYKKEERLMLLAEMKVPGEAILDFSLERQGPARTKLVVSARFLPKGLFGILYWYAMYPFHVLIFRGMIHKIASLLSE